MTTCRSCDRPTSEPILSLGRTPLANALLARDQLGQPETTYPLNLVFCPSCALLQIDETVPPEILFRDYYYFSSFSDTMVRHARELAGSLIAERKLGPTSHVVEAASNDGYLLKNYVAAGVPVTGVEPARNVAAVAERNGVRTVTEFFGTAIAPTLARADVFHANNVLAHVAGLNDFVAAIATVLAPEGLAVLEFPYLRDMLERCEFDTIYHEHLCYFSGTALAALFARHDLKLVDVLRMPIHGGSLRIFVQHAGARSAPAGGALRVETFLDEERRWGVSERRTYEDFAARIDQLGTSLRKTLGELKAAGRRIAAYGASAKGATLLHKFGIGSETLDFVVDRSTVKQGRFTPGTHLEILPPAALLERKPDYVLLLTWNFEEEILAQQAEYRAQGGRFIVPIPSVRIA